MEWEQDQTKERFTHFFEKKSPEKDLTEMMASIDKWINL